MQALRLKEMEFVIAVRRNRVSGSGPNHLLMHLFEQESDIGGLKPEEPRPTRAIGYLEADPLRR
jgi:hypothetical protein